MRRIQHGRQRSQTMQPRMLTDPAKFPDFCDEFNLGSSLVQQGCRFQSALSGSDNCDASPSEGSNVATLIAMRYLSRGQLGKDRWDFLERFNAGRDHHSLGTKIASIFESDGEAPIDTTYRCNFSLIQIGKQLTLEPLTVTDERLE